MVKLQTFPRIYTRSATGNVFLFFMGCVAGNKLDQFDAVLYFSQHIVE